MLYVALEQMRARLEACGFQETHPQAEEVRVLWDRDGAPFEEGRRLRTVVRGGHEFAIGSVADLAVLIPGAVARQA